MFFLVSLHTTIAKSVKSYLLLKKYYRILNINNNTVTSVTRHFSSHSTFYEADKIVDTLCHRKPNTLIIIDILNAQAASRSTGRGSDQGRAGAVVGRPQGDLRMEQAVARAAQLRPINQRTEN